VRLISSRLSPSQLTSSHSQSQRKGTRHIRQGGVGQDISAPKPRGLRRCHTKVCTPTLIWFVLSHAAQGFRKSYGGIILQTCGRSVEAGHLWLAPAAPGRFGAEEDEDNWVTGCIGDDIGF
jgi:hypothetical protein